MNTKLPLTAVGHLHVNCLIWRPNGFCLQSQFDFHLPTCCEHRIMFSHQITARNHFPFAPSSRIAKWNRNSNGYVFPDYNYTNSVQRCNVPVFGKQEFFLVKRWYSSIDVVQYLSPLPFSIDTDTSQRNYDIGMSAYPKGFPFRYNLINVTLP